MITQDGNTFHSFDDPLLINHLNNMLNYRKSIESKAKHKVGSMLKLTDNWVTLMNCLIPAYTNSEARQHAQRLAGHMVELMTVDELTDKGQTGLYYSVVDNLGLLWVFPENLFE